MEKEPKMYEILYLLTPLIPEEKLEDEANALRSLIEGQQGIISYENKPKRQTLAYPINKIEDAYAGLMKFVIKPDSLQYLEDSLRKNDKLIRFLISKVEIDKKIIKPRRTFVKPKQKSEKEVVKTEEIDKKLEELLGK